MDARLYFQLTDAILVARTPVALNEIECRIQATEMHPVEREVIARVLRSRADALSAEASHIARCLAHALVRSAVA